MPGSGTAVAGRPFQSTEAISVLPGRFGACGGPAGSPGASTAAVEPASAGATVTVMAAKTRPASARRELITGVSSARRGAPWLAAPLLSGTQPRPTGNALATGVTQEVPGARRIRG